MQLDELTKALRESWSAETSHGGVATAANPARGQCVVSSLVVQDFLDGELQRVRVTGGGIDEKHYFNQVDGVRIDVTWSQYSQMDVNFAPSPINLKEAATVRDKVLDEDTSRRYELLRERVNKIRKRNHD